MHILSLAGTCSNYGGRTYTSTTIPTAADTGIGPKTGAETLFKSTAGQRWFWTGSQCTQFNYGGREGNFNNFLSQADCIAYCAGDSGLCFVDTTNF